MLPRCGFSIQQPKGKCTQQKILIYNKTKILKHWQQAKMLKVGKKSVLKSDSS